MKMGKKAMSILDVKDEEFYEGMGKAFVALTESQGFFQFIEHLGRELRDFFLNLDNLHQAYLHQIILTTELDNSSRALIKMIFLER